MTQLLINLTNRIALAHEADERGAAASEYLGILVVVAAIIGAIMLLGIDQTIAGAIEGAVNDIIN